MELPDATPGGTDLWQEKIAYLLRRPVPVASFTFGTPDAEIIDRLHAVGTHVTVMVTDPERRSPQPRSGRTACVCRVRMPVGTGTHAVDKTPDGRTSTRCCATCGT